MESIRRGKWLNPDVPKSDWECTGVVDLGVGNYETCEMCEAAEIRWVHQMMHPTYQDVLQCGCICAGHMANDPEGARRRETDFRNLMKRRAGFVTRDWRVSAKGNEFLNAYGFNIVIFRAWGSMWSARVNDDEYSHKIDKPQPTRSMAKLAAFDLVQKLLE